MKGNITLKFPVRLRGGSLHLNIHKHKDIMKVEHGDIVHIRLSDITVIKHPVNTEYDKIVEQRKKELIQRKPIKAFTRKQYLKKNKHRYEVL